MENIGLSAPSTQNAIRRFIFEDMKFIFKQHTSKINFLEMYQYSKHEPIPVIQYLNQYIKNSTDIDPKH